MGLPIELQSFDADQSNVEPGDTVLLEVGTNRVLLNFRRAAIREKLEQAIAYFEGEGVTSMPYQYPENLVHKRIII